MSSQTVLQLVFGLLTLVVLGGAIGVVMARTVFVSALWLILSFIGVAGFYAILGAGFLAVVQVLIYVGAISVLILFAIMLTEDVMADARPNNNQVGVSLILLVPLIFLIGMWAFTANWQETGADLIPSGGAVLSAQSAAGVPAAQVVETVTKDADGQSSRALQPSIPDPVTFLGRSMMTEHFLAFELVSVVLLMALVGAIVIARD